MSLFSSRKKLIVGGCSYTDNYALSQGYDEFPVWGELLAEKLDMELVNLGRCGFGNKAIYNTLIESMIVEKNVGMIIAMWTEFQRTSYHNRYGFMASRKNPNKENPWVCFHPQRELLFKRNKGDPKYKLSKMLNDHFFANMEGGVVESLNYMFAFQTFCEHRNIPYLQIQGCYPLAGDLSQWRDHTKQKEICKYMIDSPYMRVIDDKHFLGWPTSHYIGGWCWDYLLDSKDEDRVKYRIGGERGDTHPNGPAHELVTGLIYDGYKKIYS